MAPEKEMQMIKVQKCGGQATLNTSSKVRNMEIVTPLNRKMLWCTIVHEPRVMGNEVYELPDDYIVFVKDTRNKKELTATAGSDVVQSGRPIFDDFFQHLWPYIGNNTANVVFQMVKRLWRICIDQ
ncbi:hypothetical protein TNCV_2275601 [Trichonephila clavipes]|nr:hypothetical protein TNCV_2275601 [Trichonephila clavipes]